MKLRCVSTTKQWTVERQWSTNMLSGLLHCAILRDRPVNLIASCHFNCTDLAWGSIIGYGASRFRQHGPANAGVNSPVVGRRARRQSDLPSRVVTRLKSLVTKLKRPLTLITKYARNTHKKGNRLLSAPGFPTDRATARLHC
jgi:hypothetical protein